MCISKVGGKSLRALSIFIVLTLLAGVFPLAAFPQAVSAAEMTDAQVQQEIISRLYNGGGWLSCDFNKYTTTPGKHEGIDFAKGAGVSIYAVISGVVTANRMPADKISTLGIYNAEHNVTVFLGHGTYDTSIKIGGTISVGTRVGVEASRGASSAHTHVELRTGKQTSMAYSSDQVLVNSNPYPYWRNLLGGNEPPDDLTPDPNWANKLPFKAFLLNNTTVYPFESNGARMSGNAEIWGSDECTISQVYTNGYCQVTYPVGNGSRTGYAWLRDFVQNPPFGHAQFTAGKNVTTYRRSDLAATYGTVYASDVCYKVSENGDKTQLIYPVTGGYKLAWVRTSETPVSPPVPTPTPTPVETLTSDPNWANKLPFRAFLLNNATVYPFESNGVRMSGNAEIWGSDECTISQVYTNGYCQVTYPVGSGTRTGYAWLRDFVQNPSFGHTQFTAGKNIGTYKRSDFASTYGTVYANDVCYKVSESGDKTQLSYPVTGGYKLAWVRTSDIDVPDLTHVPTPTPVPAPTPESTPSPTPVPTPAPLTGAAYAIDSTTAAADGTARLALSVPSNPGIISLRANILYDENALELVSVENTGLLKGYTTPSPNIASPYTLRWADSLAAADNASQGVIAYLNFVVNPSATAGDYTVTVQHLESRNVQGTAVTLTGASGAITVANTNTDNDDDHNNNNEDGTVYGPTAGQLNGIALTALVTNVGVKFDWTPNANTFGYRIYRSTVQDEEGISISDFPITTGQYVDVNVKTETQYYYTIRAVEAEAFLDQSVDPWVLTDEKVGASGEELAVLTESIVVETERIPHFILMRIGVDTMQVDEQTVEIDPGRGTTPQLVNGRTLVPIRAIVETMGGTAGWNDATQEVSLDAYGHTVEMTLDSTSIVVDGIAKEIDFAPTTINDRTMLPIRFVIDNIGCHIQWVGSTEQIIVVYYDQPDAA